MGATISNWCVHNHKREVDDRLHDVQPEYYIQNVIITDDDISKANASWDIIMSSKETIPFMERVAKRNDDTFNYTSVLTWFYDVFYNRFFEICPDAQPLFHHVSMVNQGRLIAGVISSALYSLKNPTKLKDKLTENTRRHNGKGIKSEWYTKMGEALIWALGHVIGDLFDEATNMAWRKIYSFMLSIILPLAVEYEVEEHHSTSSKQAAASRSQSASLWTTHRLDNFLVSTHIKSRKITTPSDKVAPSPSSKENEFHDLQSDTPNNGAAHGLESGSGSFPLGDKANINNEQSASNANTKDKHPEDMVQSFRYEPSSSDKFLSEKITQKPT